MGILDRFKKSAVAETALKEEKLEEVAAPVAEAAPMAEVREEASPKRGFFARLKQGLGKTTQLLRTDIRDIFKGEGRLVDDAFLEELRGKLVRTDMGPQAANQIVEEIGTQFRARVIQMDEALDVVKKKLKQLMAQDESPVKMAAAGPTVIMVCGVNGSGKTTSIAKLAKMFTGQGKKVVLGAGDTFRAAAVEQLGIWAQRLGTGIVKGAPQSDPASVAFAAVKETIDKEADVCIVDTAGRLQTQQNLMTELSKIHRVIGKQIPEAPHEVLLVLDATAGQNGISQARGFTDAVKCTGIVLAKIDGTAKGGVIVPIRQQFGLPVKLVGVGEKAEDLGVFRPDEFVEAMFEGMGAG
jgi:fused signal recognition particle receptor